MISKILLLILAPLQSGLDSLLQHRVHLCFHERPDPLRRLVNPSLKEDPLPGPILRPQNPSQPLILFRTAHPLDPGQPQIPVPNLLKIPPTVGHPPPLTIGVRIKIDFDQGMGVVGEGGIEGGRAEAACDCWEGGQQAALLQGRGG
jgi:hypothetical protein